MDFFTNAIDVLQTLVIALGGGLCVWGGINLLEGYGQDNPASNAHVRYHSLLWCFERPRHVQPNGNRIAQCV